MIRSNGLPSVVKVSRIASRFAFAFASPLSRNTTSFAFACRQTLSPLVGSSSCHLFETGSQGSSKTIPGQLATWFEHRTRESFVIDISNQYSVGEPLKSQSVLRFSSHAQSLTFSSHSEPLRVPSDSLMSFPNDSLVSFPSYSRSAEILESQ